MVQYRITVYIVKLLVQFSLTFSLILRTHSHKYINIPDIQTDQNIHLSV